MVEANDSVVTARFVASPDRFKGRVSSASYCEPNRRIVLKRVKRGPDAIVGRDTTNDFGKWKELEPRAKGRYYAKVIIKVVSRAGIQVRCNGDRSPIVRVRI